MTFDAQSTQNIFAMITIRNRARLHSETNKLIAQIILTRSIIITATEYPFHIRHNFLILIVIGSDPLRTKMTNHFIQCINQMRRPTTNIITVKLSNTDSILSFNMLSITNSNPVLHNASIHNRNLKEKMHLSMRNHIDVGIHIGSIKSIIQQLRDIICKDYVHIVKDDHSCNLIGIETIVRIKNRTINFNGPFINTMEVFDEFFTRNTISKRIRKVNTNGREYTNAKRLIGTHKTKLSTRGNHNSSFDMSSRGIINTLNIINMQRVQDRCHILAIDIHIDIIAHKRGSDR